MQTRTKILITTLVVAIPAFTVLNPHAPPGEALWPPVQDDASGLQVPFMILYGALNSLAFGFAVGFGLFGFSWTRRVFPAYPLSVHLSIAFVMGNFWLHDNLHSINGANMAGIVWLTYLFHVPIILAGAIIASSVVLTASHRPVADA